MESFDQDIYPLAILIFIFTALFILVFFRLFKFLLQFMRLSKSHSEMVRKYLPLSELVVWTLFLIWAIQYLFNRGFLLTLVPLLVFIIIILYLARFGLRDIMAGIVFKTANDLNLQDHIDVAGISGKVSAIKQSTLEIEDASGRIVSIPYSKITGSVLLRQYPSQSLLSYNFILQVPLTQMPDGPTAFIEKLRVSILTLPWASQKKEPKIHSIRENTEDVHFNITIFSLDESYFAMTEKHLENEFSGKVVR